MANFEEEKKLAAKFYRKTLMKKGWGFLLQEVRDSKYDDRFDLHFGASMYDKHTDTLVFSRDLLAENPSDAAQNSMYSAAFTMYKHLTGKDAVREYQNRHGEKPEYSGPPIASMSTGTKPAGFQQGAGLAPSYSAPETFVPAPPKAAFNPQPQYPQPTHNGYQQSMGSTPEDRPIMDFVQKSPNGNWRTVPGPSTARPQPEFNPQMPHPLREMPPSQYPTQNNFQPYEQSAQKGYWNIPGLPNPIPQPEPRYPSSVPSYPAPNPAKAIKEYLQHRINLSDEENRLFKDVKRYTGSNVVFRVSAQESNIYTANVDSREPVERQYEVVKQIAQMP